MRYLHKVSDFVFAINGNENDGYFKALSEYFSDKRIENDASFKVWLDIFVDDNNRIAGEYKPDFYSLAGSISFNKESFYIKKGPYSYIVSSLFDKNAPTKLVLCPPSPYRTSIKNKIYDFFRNPEVGNHDCYNAFVQGLTNYSCLWYIFAITLMKIDNLFIHCGMMCNNDHDGIILTGTGGCGKTSLMMELITNGGYAYMAEDFGILCRDGSICDMQKKAAIYQSDVKWGNKYLQSAVNRLPFCQLTEWKIKKESSKNPVHYFKPSELFGDNIASKARLSKVFYLKRTNRGASISVQSLTVEQVAERAKTASFREIKELYEILANIRAVGGDDYYHYYPSVYELEELYKQIIIEALHGVECAELTVPLDVNPKDTMHFLLS